MRSNVPHGGGTLDRHVGHVGPHPLWWEKFTKKFFFLIEQVEIQVKNVYVKHPYQHSTYRTSYPPQSAPLSPNHTNFDLQNLELQKVF